jgi:hypothetical protein
MPCSRLPQGELVLRRAKWVDPLDYRSATGVFRVVMGVVSNRVHDRPTRRCGAARRRWCPPHGAAGRDPKLPPLAASVLKR